MSARATALLAGLLAAAAAGCAGAPARQPWLGREALAPGPGRQALRVESSGGAQNVAVLPAGARAPDDPRPRWLCQTPCTVFLPPGVVGLYTGGLGVREGFSRVELPRGGARVRVRAPDEAAFAAARAMSTGGVFLGLIGSIFLAGSVVEGLALSSNTLATVLIGTGLLGAGVAFGVLGAREGARHPTGVDAVRPLGSGGGGFAARVSLGAAPTLGGVAALGLVRF